MRSLLILLILWLVACGAPRKEAAISTVSWSLRQGSPNDALIELTMDLPTDPDQGIAVPSARQADGGALHVRFTLTDPSAAGQRFRYMVYYRNETYAFKDKADGDLAEENFYGGFTDGFHLSTPLSDDGVVVEDRITLRSDPREEFISDHWARNPRTGRYSLLIVAQLETSFNDDPLPADVLDTRARTNGHFTEPYTYWLNGPGAQRENASMLLVPDMLALSVDLDPTKGVLGCCGDTPAFEAFIHHLDTNARFNNIPTIADALDNAFTRTIYDSLLCFTPKEAFVSTTPYVAASPCANIRLDSTTKALEIRNPAATVARPRKEQTGVRARHAFTYGRYRIHAQLSPLLNDSDLWNGLTNAIWLIGTGAPGALRRPCNGGYLSYASDGGETRRIPRTNYAEIDFEIMKGMPLCPERAFPPIYPQQVADPNDRSAWSRALPSEVLEQHGNVTVALTNWDLACPQPPRFGIGCQDITLDGEVFTSHRWDTDYRAVTQKRMEADDELFGPNGYWFEIDWRPTEIFWRIGPSPEHMRTVGYMNSSMTSIPEVPMWVAITQEFHNTAWWPGCPYEQGGIPFPGKDLTGRVFSVRID